MQKIGTLYLAHGYDPVTKPLGLEIQGKLEERGFNVINPFQRPEQVKYDYYLNNNIDFPPEIEAEIVEMDLDKVDLADGIFAIPSTTSVGTFMEIFYKSYLMDDPVWTWWVHQPRQVTTKGFVRRHPWLGHLTNLYIGVEKEAEILDAVTQHFTKSPGRSVVTR